MEIKKFKKNILTDTSKIKEALKILNTTKIKIIFIINRKKELVGTITDGDLRRAFIKGAHITDYVSKAMKGKPKFITQNDLKKNRSLNKFFLKNDIEQLPVLNERGNIVKILLSSEFSRFSLEHKNSFIIMAGGFGKRLRPLANSIPKPMVKINNKPIVQHIIENAKASGFYNIYLSVNYLKHKIEKYFGDGSKFGVRISYIRERNPLGTAGSLALIKDGNKLPVVVVNGDTVTDVNFKSLINYHRLNKSEFTIVTNFERRKREIGILETRSKKVVGFAEKPVVLTKINTGIYVISKNVIRQIKKNKFLNMNDLIKKNIKRNKVVSYPIYEKWEDVGTFSNLSKIRKEFRV